MLDEGAERSATLCRSKSPSSPFLPSPHFCLPLAGSPAPLSAPSRLSSFQEGQAKSAFQRAPHCQCRMQSMGTKKKSKRGGQADVHSATLPSRPSRHRSVAKHCPPVCEDGARLFQLFPAAHALGHNTYALHFRSSTCSSLPG